MENLTVLLVPVLTAVVLTRLLLLPIKAVLKLGFHSGCGFLCLLLLNTVAPFTGIEFPMNAVTILTAGFLGIPGIGLLAVLSIL